MGIEWFWGLFVLCDRAKVLHTGSTVPGTRYDYLGSLSLRTDTLETTVSFIQAIRSEIERLKAEPVTQN